jgi:hypothetical protein
MGRVPRKGAWAGAATLAVALLVAYLNGGVEGVLGQLTDGQAPAVRRDSPAVVPERPGSTATRSRDAGPELERLFRARISGEVVEGSGRLRAVLPDDNHGSRHQRFLLEFSGGHTVLVSHNIDLAPRVEALRKGDDVEFRGQYEWNEKGGVLHWTHHDPDGRRPGGWLRHAGATYR